MIFEHKYKNNSTIENSGSKTNMSFSPDLKRDPVFFVGKINKKINFREAISALHDVVISDKRFQPKDKTAYKEWAAEQEKLQLVEYMAKSAIDSVNDRIGILSEELQKVYTHKNKLLQPFYDAQRKYFNYLYKNDIETWRVLDPVITVHPDEIFFECFSIDESSYGKLICSHNVFDSIDDVKYGTTNVDYSSSLYNEFQKIRNYKETQLTIDPSGFETQTSGSDIYKEVKIDVPDSWVRGFLQVSAAMTMPAIEFDLHPMDVHSLCQYLRRYKEKNGPRALRYILTPGQPIQVMFEPWNELITFHRSFYTGNSASTVRVWGRRRIHILERLLPIANNFKVVLLGSGMPSFYVAQMDDMSFTLGLSGWTTNDWTKVAAFDLLAPRGNVSYNTKKEIFGFMRKNYFSNVDNITKNLSFSAQEVSSSLLAYTQAGKIVYDIVNKVHRLRELTSDEINLSSLRFSSPEESAAQILIDANAVTVKHSIKDDLLLLQGTIKVSKAYLNTSVYLDKDRSIKNATCQCDLIKYNGLKKGPCEHILATVKLKFS